MDRHPQSSRRGFTITELLVSMGILVLLIVLVAQLTSVATTVTTGSRKHMDADSQARLVFDRIAGDFSKMVKRNDVDYFFDKQTGAGKGANDRLFFYSEAPAYFPDSANAATKANSTALIGYRINASFELERLGKQLSWDGTFSAPSPGGMVFLSYPESAASPSPTPHAEGLLETHWASVVDSGSTDSDYHMIAEGVFRLEYCFLLKDGTYSNDPDGTYGAGSSSHSLQNVSAIVVAIGILDSTSRKIAPNLTDLSGAFLDPTDANLTSPPLTLMFQTWNTALISSSFASSTSLPQAAASQIRIYQRIFYLNQTGK